MAISLNMPLFATVADVATRIGVDATLDGAQEILESAIKGAQLRVQLTTGSLAKQTHNLTFFLDKDKFSGMQPGGVFRLELPCCFLRTDVDPTITVSPPVTDDNLNLRFAEYTEIDTDYVAYDRKLGYILIDAGLYKDTFVKVTCVTGFEDGVSTPYPTEDVAAWASGTAYTLDDLVVYDDLVYIAIAASTGVTPGTDSTKWTLKYVDLEQIPADIYDAITMLVPGMLDANQNTNRNKEAEAQYKNATEHAFRLLSKYVRNNGFSFRPE